MDMDSNMSEIKMSWLCILKNGSRAYSVSYLLVKITFGVNIKSAQSLVIKQQTRVMYSTCSRHQAMTSLWSKIEKNTDKIAIQSFTVPRVSGASERANGRASGPVCTS